MSVLTCSLQAKKSTQQREAVDRLATNIHNPSVISINNMASFISYVIFFLVYTVLY